MLTFNHNDATEPGDPTCTKVTITDAPYVHRYHIDIVREETNENKSQFQMFLTKSELRELLDELSGILGED